MAFLKKILSIGEGRSMKRYWDKTEKVGSFEDHFRACADDEFPAITEEFRKRYRNGETLDDLMPEAFAAAREAALRSIGLRPFDVQLIGGMVLNDGKIAEAATGEGKTLISVLPGYLNAITGEPVHIVTVNDYLAERDSKTMGKVYSFLGMRTSFVNSTMSPEQKRYAYEADVVYGTNSEFGFDYLRDNMVGQPSARMQRGLGFAIVDEVDSILIDEARTPLIISGAGAEVNDLYSKFARAVRGLAKDDDYELDEAKKTIFPTEQGLAKIEAELGIEDIFAETRGNLPNHLMQAMKAEYMFSLNVDYIVTDGEVKIVDEFTGRVMEGRRWSDGLHQAVEAKEGVYVKRENQTLATITLQNYFRLYSKLSGMTGTAMTEEAEFRNIYKLEVVSVPTNKPVARIDLPDAVYKDVPTKYRAVANKIAVCAGQGQPVLVGTTSIENSEKLSRLLQKRGIKHNVLNAKNHEREAQIVAQAGRKGAVTIATNMAGRGTDIKLGGSPEDVAAGLMRDAGIEEDAPNYEAAYQAALRRAEAECKKEEAEVLEAGGLLVIGTERHESRRIDNQLRGRSGRQGDPGCSQFFISLSDDLMRIFGAEKMEGIAAMMERNGLDEDAPLESKMVSKAIENAQRKVEGMNYEIRKHILEYDDVMNKQRSVIYEYRNQLLDQDSCITKAPDRVTALVERRVHEFCNRRVPNEDWEWGEFQAWYDTMIPDSPVDLSTRFMDAEIEEVEEAVFDDFMEVWNTHEEELGEAFEGLLRGILLRIMDTRWMEFLDSMDYLKTGIGLRGYAQRDPLVEYKEEAYIAFSQLVDGMYEDYIRTVLRISVVQQEQSDAEGSMGGESVPAAVQGEGDVAQATISDPYLGGGDDKNDVPATGAGELKGFPPSIKIDPLLPKKQAKKGEAGTPIDADGDGKPDVSMRPGIIDGESPMNAAIEGGLSFEGPDER